MFEFDKEMKKIIKKIESGIIKPADINDMFNDDYGTKVNIEWINNTDSIQTKTRAIIRSMFNAATNVANSINSDVEADMMFYPVLFCYLQYLEVAFKWIVETNNKYVEEGLEKNKIKLQGRDHGHNLMVIWKKLETIVKQKLCLNNNTYECIDEIVKNVLSLSETSMAYRYAYKENKKTKTKEEYINNKKFSVDLKMLVILMNILDEYLFPLYELEWHEDFNEE